MRPPGATTAEARVQPPQPVRDTGPTVESAGGATADAAVRRRPPAAGVFAVVAVAVVAAAPHVLSPFALGIVNLIGLAAISAMALNLLTGTAGLLSIGTAAFLGIGAFTSAYVASRAGIPFPLVIAAAGVTSAVVGAVIGIPSLRFRGLYLVIATLALHFIAQYALQKFQFAQVGPGGYALKNPVIGPLVLNSRERWYYAIALAAAGCYAGLRNLSLSRLGRAWRAIRDCENAAVASGVKVRRAKILVFVISASVTGMAGALTAYYVRAAQVDSYSLQLAIDYVAMIIIGGLGSQVGSVLGAAFVIGLPVVVNEWAPHLPMWVPFSSQVQAHLYETQQIIYGAFIVAFILFEPHGLVALARRVATASRRLSRAAVARAGQRPRQEAR
jgi:branched-chain amino acid transport system permease protein